MPFRRQSGVGGHGGNSGAGATSQDQPLPVAAEVPAFHSAPPARKPAERLPHPTHGAAAAATHNGPIDASALPRWRFAGTPATRALRRFSPLSFTSYGAMDYEVRRM